MATKQVANQRKTTASKSKTGSRGASTTKKKPSARGKKQVQRNFAPWAASFTIGALLLAVFLFVDGGGIVNAVVKTTLLGLFGKPAAIVPLLLLGSAVYLLKTKDVHAFHVKLLLLFLALVNVSALFHLASPVMIPVKEAFDSGAGTVLGSFSSSVGGGFFGGCIGMALEFLFRRLASFVILAFTLISLISLITRVSIFSAVAGFAGGVYRSIRESLSAVDEEKAYQKGYEAQMKAATKVKQKVRRKPQIEEYMEEEYPQVSVQDPDAFGYEVLDVAQSFAQDKPEKKKAGITKLFEKKEKEEKPKVTAVPEPTPSQPEDKPFETGLEKIFGDLGALFDGEPEAEPADPVGLVDAGIPEEPVKEPPKEREKNLTEQEQELFAQELDSAIEKPVVEYVYPTTDLLRESNEESADMRKEMYETANKLISVLDNFNVKAKLLQVTQGPSVTRYEIQPNTGVKLSKIVGLADDLALNLAVSNVLVAPVPGKAAVGIEVPNREVGSVSVRELLESNEFRNSKSKLSVVLGKDIGGRVVVGDIAKMPHVLIAGATGSGKSVCINTIITSILYKASPDEVKLIMVDPKVVELGVYNGIPHLLIPVVTDPKRAAGALNWAVAEMMHRYDLFAQNAVRNLEGYNKLMEKTGEEKLPQIVIIIDELADLMMVAAKEVEDYVCRLAQLARAAGIHLIIATQRPSVDVITGLIKANIPSRIAFAVSSQVDSRTILDKGGAEKLLGKGDMLYFPTGARVPVRVQGAFVSDPEIENILNFLKENEEDTHYSEDLAEHIERCSTGENGVTPDEEDDGDELLPQAIELAAELGQISTAMVQRRLKVGYSRAGRIIDQMEARGIIGGANGSKPRQVYISRGDLLGGE